MTDIRKWWAELEKLYAYYDNHPDDYSNAMVERVITLEDRIADAKPQTFEDVHIKLCACMQQLRYEGGGETSSSLQYRLIHSAAYALAPSGLA